MSTLVEVAMTYAWATRRRGTPLSLLFYGPTDQLSIIPSTFPTAGPPLT
jgi:hypothetical protein